METQTQYYDGFMYGEVGQRENKGLRKFVSQLRGLILEQVRSSDPFILKTREHLLIQKFDTVRNGLTQES